MKKAIIPVTITIVIFIIGFLILSNRSSTETHEYIIEVEMTDERRAEIEERLAAVEAEMAEYLSEGEEIPLRLFRLQAEDYRELGYLSKAERIYRDYLQKNPLDKVAQNNLGSLLMRMERYQEAERIYSHILNNFDVTESDIRNYLRSVRAMNPNDRRIINTLETAVLVNGQSPYLMSEIASWHESQGNCQLALDHLRIIPQLDPATTEQVNQDIDQLKQRCQ